MNSLVVVESPTKSKTIERYLGPDFIVLATVGHFRDVEDNGVDTKNEFALKFKIHDDKRKILKKIVTTLKDCGTLILATDPDREGEAIAWHLHEYLQEKKALANKTVQRVVFNEITETAIRKAFEQPREIDNKLVDSALARRALDMLFGFGISRVLWHALPGTKSGGRVQSPSLRLTCEREEEIEKFVPQEHWTVNATLKTQAGKDIKFHLTHLDGQKLKKFSLENETEAQQAADQVSTGTFSVSTVKRRQVQKRPSAPFRTSTLQQVASRTLNMSPEYSAGVAQELFREGLITYMRTDSVVLSSNAISAIRAAIEHSPSLGKKYLPSKPIPYSNRIKNAQEAHEAIRPTDIATSPKHLPTHLKRDAVRLYDLIWKRAMASQMEKGLDDQLSIDASSSDQKLVLHAAGSTVAFDGFRKIYYEENDDEQSESKEDGRLPDVKPNEPLELSAVSPEQHYTKPPARYNEASLIAKLEELGIGRPSTYPGIIKKLKERTYITVENKQLVPQDMGRGKVILLECLFDFLVDYTFTAELEEKLDEIANGKLAYKEIMTEFYPSFAKSCDAALGLKGEDILNAMNKFAGARFFPLSEDRKILKCSKCNIGDYSFKNSTKSGVFLGCTEYKNDGTGCKHTLPLAKKKRHETGELGLSDNGEVISLLTGRFGAFVQQGEKSVEGRKPKTASVPKGVEPEDVDLAMAKKLLSLPRIICEHPETRKTIWAKQGPHGPYIDHDGDTRSLGAEDDVYTIGCNHAVDLLAQPKKARSFRRGSEKIRSLGPHSEDGNEVAIYKGQYGHYIKHNKTNAGLPKHSDAETITIEKAEQVVAEKASKPKKPSKKKKAATKRKRNPRPKKDD